jgi:hypothetical protein
MHTTVTAIASNESSRAATAMSNPERIVPFSYGHLFPRPLRREQDVEFGITRITQDFQHNLHFLFHNSHINT